MYKWHNCWSKLSCKFGHFQKQDFPLLQLIRKIWSRNPLRYLRLKDRNFEPTIWRKTLLSHCCQSERISDWVSFPKHFVARRPDRQIFRSSRRPFQFLGSFQKTDLKLSPKRFWQNSILNGFRKANAAGWVRLGKNVAKNLSKFLDFPRWQSGWISRIPGCRNFLAGNLTQKILKKIAQSFILKLKSKSTT